MITEHLVDISRLQFAVTALYHFLSSVAVKPPTSGGGYKATP